MAIDFAEPSHLAARWVTRHLIGDAELVLVHVVPRLDRPVFMRGSAPTIEELGETMRRGADVRLREMSRSLGAVRIWPEIRAGDPAHEILSAASDYAVDLIVVGESEERTGARRLLGSTAERVLRDADVPVFLARNLTDAPPRHILLAIDDARETSRLLAWTEMLASHFLAKVSVLHVVSPAASSPVQIVTAGVNPERALQGLADSARQWLDGLVGSTRERIGDVTSSVSFGEVGSEIVSAIDRLGSDLVVIGRGGVGSAAAAILGSVTRYVLHASDGPLLIVPTSARARKSS